MSQSSRTLLGLAALLIVAGGIGLYAWKGVYQADQEAAQKKERDERIFTTRKTVGGEAPAAQFLTLTVTFGGETTRLTRQRGGPWRIVAPVSAKADTLVVDALVSQLETARFKATLDEAPDEATIERYGLRHPSFVVEATAEVGEGHEPITLKLEGGIENTFDGSTFVRRNGEKPVYTVQGGVRSALAKSTFELRDKQILSVDEAQLKGMAVKTARSSWSLERNAQGQWAIVRPRPELADGAQVSSMLGSLASEKAQSFPQNSAGLLRAFDAPAVDATFTAKDGAVTRIRVGRSAADAGSRWYALREDSDGAAVAEVDSGAPGHLDKRPADLEDKTLVHFNKDAVTTIVMTQGGERLTLIKASVDASAEAWRVAAPREGKAKVFKVTSLLWALGSLKATAWGEAKPKNWGKFGIDGRARSIGLYGSDGVELGRLAIGTELKDKKGTFFVRGQKNQVAECDGTRFSEFPFSLSDVLDEPVDAGVTEAG